MSGRAYIAKERTHALALIAKTSVRHAHRTLGIPITTLKTWKVEAVGVTRRNLLEETTQCVREEQRITARGVALALGIERSTARKQLRRAMQLQHVERIDGRIPWYVPTVRKWTRAA